MIYRFLGNNLELTEPAVTMTQFGSSVDIPSAEIAENFIRVGAPLIPDATFSSIGFTKEELEKHASADTHDAADEQFKKKKKAALDALHELREGLKAGTRTLATASPKEV